MSKEDISLGVEMGKLKIEPLKLNKNVKEENPFVNVSQSLQNRGLVPRISTHNQNCCWYYKNNKNIRISKKKHIKILREPVLKILKNCIHNTSVKEEHELLTYKCRHHTNSDNINLCALVDNCNQLRISSNANEQNTLATELNSEMQWWKKKVSSSGSSRDHQISGKSQTGSCSQQALNPPCDVTIDELASYFETLVHIPKKMSSMAEMMYI